MKSVVQVTYLGLRCYLVPLFVKKVSGNDKVKFPSNCSLNKIE